MQIEIFCYNKRSRDNYLNNLVQYLIVSYLNKATWRLWSLEYQKALENEIKTARLFQGFWLWVVLLACGSQLKIHMFKQNYVLSINQKLLILEYKHFDIPVLTQSFVWIVSYCWTTDSFERRPVAGSWELAREREQTKFDRRRKVEIISRRLKLKIKVIETFSLS